MFALCDQRAGTMRQFVPAKLPRQRIKLDANLLDRSRRLVGRYFNGQSLPWNLELFISSSETDDIGLFAFQRTELLWAEEHVDGAKGQHDVPMRIVEAMRKSGGNSSACNRYDVGTPVRPVDMRLWLLPSLAKLFDSCAGCGGKARAQAKLRLCSACMTTRYCSVECQRADRRSHACASLRDCAVKFVSREAAKAVQAECK